ncbi:von Willebrand factor type A [Spirochaeta thermophila DSM 6578]|uniref:von Willebrand factor type A n=1 Tax=Winmispira thermophila (strain ATCC 700085 / DSM 6578 / Z-1203) TaxID=869211 RepID=G0GA30_WINT7|nr:VWA domain-containing protein [Spirochaeta thermophila]AEJ61718.1 von Willebrand factor type A [Spirochaeta thermophila DSM 6578]
MKVRYAFMLVAGMLMGGALSSQTLTITQVDTSSLLFTQTVRAYFYVDNLPGGKVLTAADITAQESPDGASWRLLPVRSLRRGVNREEGISFLLVLDASGSMWDALDGTPTEDPDRMRITHAKRAIREFLPLLSERDRVGLAVFNRTYRMIQPIVDDPALVLEKLDAIERPSREQAYTELYRSMEEALTSFEEEGRRRVLVVLSDGENFPVDPEKSPATPGTAVDLAHRYGITCYVIHFGTEKDRLIGDLASETGGRVFDARNALELASVYTAIQEQVLQEYAVAYYAAMFPGERRYVRIALKGSGTSDEQYYYAGTVLGSASSGVPWYALVLMLLAIGVWAFFLLFKLEKETTRAGLQLLFGAPGMGTRMFALAGTKTVIGGDATADITITGNPSLRPQAATIYYDPDRGQYTIQGDAELTVNNQPVTSKKLEPGDVINISGTVVVFDAPDEEKRKKKG